MSVLALDPNSPAGLVLAHGLGGRSDLPPDARMAAIGAAIAVAVSFAIVVVSWPQERIGRGTGRPLGRLGRIVDAKAVTAVLRATVLLLTVLVIAVALFGPEEARFNLAPYALYVVFWVGLAFLSVLFGPVWVRLNPLRTVHAALCRLGGRDPDEAVLQLSPKVGMWPAAAALLIFVWLELVYPQRAEPYVVGLFLTAYSVVTIVLALLFGRRWFRAGDGFEVYSRLFGSLAPLARGPKGELVLRSPLQGLAAMKPVPGLTAAVVVLIGSTGFDGLTRTALWRREVDPDSVVLGTAGLLALIAVVAVLYDGAMYVGARLSGRSSDELPDLFAPSLVPIALGYTVAHYFSFFVFEGQVALALASDPFGQGWNLFGTAENSVNYLVIGTTAIARVQVYAIVLGHVCGVVAAHDRALSLLPPKPARRSQYALALVMVGITLCGVLLLLSG